PAVAVAAASGDETARRPHRAVRLAADRRSPSPACWPAVRPTSPEVCHVGDIIREANSAQPMRRRGAAAGCSGRLCGADHLRIEWRRRRSRRWSPPPPPMPETAAAARLLRLQPEAGPPAAQPRAGPALTGMATSWRLSTRATRPSAGPSGWSSARNGAPHTRRRRSSEGKAFFPASRIVPGTADRLKQLYTKLHHQKPVMYRAQNQLPNFDRAELALLRDVARLANEPRLLLVPLGPLRGGQRPACAGGSAAVSFEVLPAQG
uniref:SLC12 domain-containing protein n=1 Tax=Macrostomum lignano TaxID=282301 RepID=A0A1I8FHF2_9PLAT